MTLGGSWPRPSTSGRSCATGCAGCRCEPGGSGQRSSCPPVSTGGALSVLRGAAFSGGISPRGPWTPCRAQRRIGIRHPAQPDRRSQLSPACHSPPRVSELRGSSPKVLSPHCVGSFPGLSPDPQLDHFRVAAAQASFC